MRVGDLDQLTHGGWGCGHCALKETEEQESAGTRVPAIEAEGELVEVGLQVLRGDARLMGAGEPAFSRLATRWTPGSTSWAYRPERLMLNGLCPNVSAIAGG